MTNLSLKSQNVVPCYCHHKLPTMWEVLNTISLSICRTMRESGYLWLHSITNVLSCCKPPIPRIGSLILKTQQISSSSSNELLLDSTSVTNSNGLESEEYTVLGAWIGAALEVVDFQQVVVSVVPTEARISAADAVRCANAVQRILRSSLSVLPEPGLLEAVLSLDHNSQ
ncbi:uncharacterized protein TNCV_1065991 [Trichonephila clavipes]|nr:uncharacterized protein TNCV_1065991 [Trichonephila clavipes]